MLEKMELLETHINAGGNVYFEGDNLSYSLCGTYHILFNWSKNFRYILRVEHFERTTKDCCG
jgi:hypothetical protein